MNNWFFFSLAAPLLWAFCNVIDTTARRHFVKSDVALSWLASITRLPLIPILFWLGGWQIPALGTALGLLVAGLFWLLPFAFYYKALATEETSRVILFLELQPVFTLGIAFVLIGEKLTGIQGWAFLLILLGNLMAALKHFEGKWHFSKAFAFVLLAGAGWALSDVLFKKYAANFDNYFASAAIYSLGMFFLAPMLMVRREWFKSIVSHFRGLSRRIWKFLAFDIIAGLLGTLVFSYALTLGKASLTMVVSGMQPLFVFVLGLILIRFIPEVAREDMSKSALGLKGFAFALMVIGLWMLS
ncbi:MAG: DMT family transporter [Candidatus Peregrinibacteria bacterium]